MRVAVTFGDSVAVPSATARTAAAISRGGVSLSRKPAAPAASAAYTYSSTWNVVRTATCGGAGSARVRRGASRPALPGIRESDRESTPLNSRHPNNSDAVFFFNDTATTEISTLSLHAALPICGGDLPRGGVLEQEARRTGGQRRVHVLVHVECGEDGDLRRVGQREDAPGRLQPVHAGHPDV